MGDSFALNQWEDVFRLSAGGKDATTAAQQVALKAGAGQRHVVRDRKRDQQNVIRHYIDYRRGDLGIVDVVIVRARNQLWNAGGAAGELEHGRVRRVNGDSFQRIVRYSALPLEQVSE